VITIKIPFPFLAIMDIIAPGCRTCPSFEQYPEELIMEKTCPRKERETRGQVLVINLLI